MKGTRFFHQGYKLGVDKVAEEDACRIEHDISKESFNAIKKAISAQLKELENNK